MQEFINGYFGIKLIPTLIISTLIFAGYKEKRSYFWLRFICSLIVFTAIATLVGNLLRNTFADNVMLVKLVSCFLSVMYFFELCGVMCFLLKCSFLEAVLFSVCGWSVEHISYCISVIIGIGCNMDGVVYRDYGVEYFIVSVMTYIIVYCSVFIVFWRLGKRSDFDLDKKKVLVPVIILMTVYSVLNAYAPMYGAEKDAIISFKIYSMATTVATLCLALGLFESGRYRYELQTITELDRRRREQYEISKETIEVINTKCHDLKKMLSGMLSGNIRGSDIESINNQLAIYDSIVKTGNDYLDIVLTDKSLYCESKDIRLTVMADAEKLNFLSDMEIYSIFGNILDNAVEAVINLEPEKRVISLSVKGNDGILCIHSDNFYGTPILKDGERVKTSKSDKTQHGFGLLSIKRVVDKYNGAMTIDADGEIFSIDIILPIAR